MSIKSRLLDARNSLGMLFIGTTVPLKKHQTCGNYSTPFFTEAHAVFSPDISFCRECKNIWTRCDYLNADPHPQGKHYRSSGITRAWERYGPGLATVFYVVSLSWIVYRLPETVSYLNAWANYHGIPEFWRALCDQPWLTSKLFLAINLIGLEILLRRQTKKSQTQKQTDLWCDHEEKRPSEEFRKVLRDSPCTGTYTGFGLPDGRSNPRSPDGSSVVVYPVAFVDRKVLIHKAAATDYSEDGTRFVDVPDELRPGGIVRRRITDTKTGVVYGGDMSFDTPASVWEFSKMQTIQKILENEKLDNPESWVIHHQFKAAEVE